MIKDDLELINSLNMSEVVYFKRTLSAYVSNEKITYLDLFDELKATKKEGAALKEHLQTVFIGRNLDEIRKNLRNAILKSLRNYHANRGKSIAIKVHEMIASLHILIDKGLIAQAMRQYRLTEKIIQRYAMHHHLIELQTIERRLVRQFKTKKLPEAIAGIRNKSRRTMKIVNALTEVNSAYEQFFILSRLSAKEGFQEKLTIACDNFTQLVHQLGDVFHYSIKAINFEEIKGLGTLTSKEIENYLHLSMYYWHVLKAKVATEAIKQQHYEKALNHIHYLKELYNTNASLIQKSPARYLKIINNLINSHLRLQQYEELLLLTEQIRNTQANNFKLEAQIQAQAYHFEGIVYWYQQEYSKAQKLGPAIKKVLTQYDAYIPFERRFALIFNMALVYFMEKKWEETQSWNNLLLQKQTNKYFDEDFLKTPVALAGQLRSRVLELIIAFEKGKIDASEKKLVEYLIPSVKRFLKTNKFDRTFDNLIVSCIEKIQLQPAKEGKYFSELASKKKDSTHKEYKMWIEWNLSSHT